MEEVNALALDISRLRSAADTRDLLEELIKRYHSDEMANLMMLIADLYAMQYTQELITKLLTKWGYGGDDNQG